MKKQILLLILAVLPLSSWADDSGKCGENVTYYYDESTKILKISGSGEMEDYAFSGIAKNPPWIWKGYSKDIASVIIGDGITSIGINAFHNCSSLTSVTIPEGVKSIEERVFCGCSSLTIINIPNSVTSIGSYAFKFCI